MGLLSSDTSIEYPWWVKKGAKGIRKIAESPTPDIPVQPIAGLTDLEQFGQDLLSSYARNPSPELLNALNSLGQIQQETSILDVPEYSALYNKTLESGNDMLNRLGRTIQLSGNASSTSGRNVLGRGVEDVQNSLLGTLAPYAAQERERRFNAPLLAAELTNADTTGRLNAISSMGALPRQIQQLENDAQQAVDRELALFDWNYRLPAYQALTGVPAAITSTTTPSMFATASPILSSLLSGIGSGGLSGLFGGGGSAALDMFGGGPPAPGMLSSLGGILSGLGSGAAGLAGGIGSGVMSGLAGLAALL